MILKGRNDLKQLQIQLGDCKVDHLSSYPISTFWLERQRHQCAKFTLANFPSTCEGVSEALRPASEALLHDIPFVGKDPVVVQEISYNEIIAKGSSVVNGIQSKQEQVENRLYNQGAGDIPKYVNLEPSLAMD